MEKTAINFPDEVQRTIDSKRAYIAQAHEALNDEPTAENMQLYQNAIRDFVSLVVIQIYSLSAKSKWHDVPCRDLYERVNGVEEELAALTEKINGSSKDYLSEQCSRIDKLLDELLVRS